MEPCGHSPRVWQTDRRTDRQTVWQTDWRTDRITITDTVQRIASHGKNGAVTILVFAIKPNLRYFQPFLHPRSPKRECVYVLQMFFCFFSVRQKIWDNRSQERLNGFLWNCYQTLGGNVVCIAVPKWGLGPKIFWGLKTENSGSIAISTLRLVHSWLGIIGN